MDFLEILKEAINNPDDADFGMLRIRCSESEHYSPYSRDEEHGKGLNSALDDQEWDQVISHAEFLIRENYLDIEAHSAAELAWMQKGEQEKSVFHGKFSGGLLKSILDSGDGKSFGTAFIVIDPREEHLVIKVLGMETISQDLVMDTDSRQYDVHKAKKGTQETEIYFNVDRPKCWLDMNLSSL